MGVGAGLYMYDIVVKSSRSLSHLMCSCTPLCFKYTTSYSKMNADCFREIAVGFKVDGGDVYAPNNFSNCYLEETLLSV